MSDDHKVAASNRSPARHEEAGQGKERSRSHADRHRRSKSKSRDRKERGSKERADSKRHTSSRKHSTSRSPSRSRSRGKGAFRARQYSPPRKRPKHSRSRSSSPALLLGPQHARQSTSPAAYGPTRPLHPGRIPAPYDPRWQPRGFEGPVLREPPTYSSYGPSGPPYGAQPPARRWAAGPSSRLGARLERRSPPPHWAGRVNPTTGSPIHEPSPVEPRDRAIAGIPQRGSGQWGTSIGWERIGNGSDPASVGPSLRHSPISPVHDPVDRDVVHSTTTPRHRLDSTALPHIAMSPPIEATWHSSDQVTSSAGEAERHLRSPEVQTGPTRTDKATQESAGDVYPHGHTEHHSAAGPLAKQDAGIMDAMIGQGMDQKARPVAQNIKQPPEARGHGKLDHTKPGSQLTMQELGKSAEQQIPMATPSAYQGTPQHTVASPEAAAHQQAAGQAVQQAEERLRDLVLGADYSERDWYYVDPQGATQGPCCIAEFRGWMHDLQMDPQLSQALKQFSEVPAWKDGAPFSVKMKSLMATVNQLSPSPPSSPTPRDTKLAGNGTLV